MIARSSLAFLVLAALAAGCGGSEAPPTDSPPVEAAPEATPPEPAEPAAPEESAAPEDAPEEKPATETGQTPDEPEQPTGEGGKWDAYTAVLPFEIGSEKGMAVAAAKNRPAMLFYTATW